jgi:hypothetical protein
LMHEPPARHQRCPEQRRDKYCLRPHPHSP